jgi:glycosyltransferase involved in cell wall biosynthesis
MIKIMQKVVKFFLGDITKESRNKREILTLLEMGYKVVALCRGVKKTNYMSKNGYLIYKFNKLDVILKQPKPLRILKIFFYWLQLSKILRSLKPDCISCHDLIALFIGWLSTLFITKRKKPILVYDSHEFEIGRNTDGKRGKIVKWFIPRLEKFLISKSAFTIMPSDSIADEVQKNYNLNGRPLVVRNIPNYWEIDSNTCLAKRKYLCELLNIPVDTFLIMHHGGIMTERGIEKIISATSKIKDIALIILGNGENKYMNKLKIQVKEENVENRVLFHKAVPFDELWKYVGAVDAGVIPIQNICKNHYLSLPNKLFENIQSETPVIASNFPEIKKIVEGYDIGLCCNPDSIEDITDAIKTLKNNEVLYKKFKKNLKEAKKELCWENEKQILVDAYKKVLN